MLARLVQPYHLKVFFSNKYLHATVLNKLTNSTVISVSTNHPSFAEALGQQCPKNDERACRLAARYIAERARQQRVNKLFWDGEVSQKTTKKEHRTKAEVLWQTLVGSGLPLERKDEQLPGQASFLPQELEFHEDDEGYADTSIMGPKEQQLVQPGSEGNQPDRQRHRQPLPRRARRNPHVAPQFRQQMWKLMSKRAQMRKAVQRVAQPA